MRTILIILAVDAALLAALLLAWADLLRPLVYTIFALWLAGWIIAAYVNLLAAPINIGASVVCFGVAMLSGVVAILLTIPRTPRRVPGVIGKC